MVKANLPIGLESTFCSWLNNIHVFDKSVHADDTFLVISDLNTNEAILTPAFAPRVLDDPVVGTRLRVNSIAILHAGSVHHLNGLERNVLAALSSPLATLVDPLLEFPLVTFADLRFSLFP